MRQKITPILVLAILLSLLGQDAFAQRKKNAQSQQNFEARYIPKDIPEVPKDEQICFALYTVNNNILKLTAQLYPLGGDDPRTVRLEARQGGKWKQIAATEVIEDGWTAPFRVENWDSTKTVEYRVAHGKTAFFNGKILRDPVDKDVIVVAGFTGNSVAKNHGGDLPKSDIVENIKKIKPDLLFFSGDQDYSNIQHLKFWLQFG